MSSGTIITDYLGRGLLSARPATPPVPTGGTGFYYATDVTTTYVWTGSAWASVGQSYDWNVDDANIASMFVHPTDGKTISSLYNAAGDGSIRGSASHAAASGKFYFEFLVKAVSSTHFPIVGVATAAHSLFTFVGGDAAAGSGYGMGMGGTAWTGNASTGSLSTYAANDVLGVAVDFTAATGSVTFYKNNVSNKVYGSLSPGTLFPAAGFRANTVSAQSKGILRLRAADQTYAPPAGFSAWS
jgi:hypothetical protein